MSNNKVIRQRNIRYFASYYRLILFSVVVAVMVIVGSLVIGDSVRATLRKQVEERLGQSESVIFARQSMLEDSILQHPTLNGTRGYMLTEGFISYQGTMLPVMVWGTDGIDKVLINEALSKELGGVPSEDLVLRLPAAGVVPSGSMFVTDNYTTSLRVTIAGVLDADEGGNINLRNEQIHPLNIFVPRAQLNKTMEQEGKINLILADNHISDQQWTKAWNYEHSGLKIATKDGFQEITSSRIFLQDAVVESICRDNKATNRLYSYLANDIASQRDTIPYSFVTAMDCYKDVELDKNDIILSDYSALRLGVKVGDSVDISYFVAEDMKRLSTQWQKLIVKAIVPVEELQADNTLSVEYPGLSDVERCTEWDSDLPIDMDRIEPEDEDYWYKYRQTPKAVISYSLIKQDWKSDYGTATAVRITDGGLNLNALTPQMFGLDLFYPQDKAIYAANNGVDFAGLFLALGFFIIAAALLLMYVPLGEMYTLRAAEFRTMLIIGYTPHRISRMLFNEALPIVLAGCVAGIVAGVVYTRGMLWLLEGVWHGATHASSFSIHLRPLTILMGVASGVIVTLCVLWFAIRNAVKALDQDDDSRNSVKSNTSVVGWLWLNVISLATIAISTYAFVGKGSVLMSVLAGLLAMISAIGWIYRWIVQQRRAQLTSPCLNHKRLLTGALYTTRKQVAQSLLILSFGVFTVFVVGLNRRSFGDVQQLSGATGGYSLWCQTSVPLQHDISTEQGRAKLAIAQEWDSQAEVLTCMSYVVDDASCLNLNKVSEPTVLGVDFDDVKRSSFALADNIYGHTDREQLMRELSRPLGENTYPATIDATALMWSLGKELGDTLQYKTHSGEELNIVLAATFAGSVFQGNILIDKQLFTQAWPEHNGTSLFLVKTQAETDMKNLLSQGLYEYGMRVVPTAQRLKTLNEVTDTYLTIFMTLGSIGLLLGLLSFVIIIRKNLVRNRANIHHLLMLGFKIENIAKMLYRENMFVPYAAIAIGFVGAVIGIGQQIAAVGLLIWIGAVTVIAMLCLVTHFFLWRQIMQTIKSVEDITNH